MPGGLRLLRAGLLIGFGLLIGKLFASGQMAKYMSPSLDPLTALTGLLLVAMGVMELRGVAGHTHHEQADLTEQILTLAVLVLPLLLGLLYTPRALGASSLGGERVEGLLLSFGRGAVPAVTAPTPLPPARPVEDTGDLLAYLRQAGEQGVGQRVRLTGLVARSETFSPAEFGLLRFSIAHCVADARPLAFLVSTPGDVAWPTDQWVQIEGVLASHERGGDRLVTIEADSIRAVEEPREPYLQPF